MAIEIQLSKKGKLAGKYISLVDDEDKILAELNWSPDSRLNYAKRSILRNGQWQIILLHRVVLSRKLDRELLSTELVDHIDGDGLNNRRENLRLATNAQNQMNRKIGTSNTSGYKGVYWHKSSQKWMARIGVGGRQKYLGVFDTPELAYEAYKKAATEIYKEFARLD
jgi:hypothetical protein